MIKVQVKFGKIPLSELESRSRGGYTYLCRDDSVGVGDVVLVPGNWVNPESQVATVTQIGSSYAGEMSSVISVVERATKN